LTFNRMAERMYGYLFREMVGRPVELLWDESPAEGGPTGSTSAAKTRHRRKDGRVLPVLVQHTDILGEEGREIAHLYVVEDLTEREQMEAQLLYAEKLALLGQLAPRIAHEFKTPMQLVSGHAELGLLLLSAGKTDEARSSLERIQPAVARMLALVRQMSDLGKPEQAQKQVLDLVAMLEQTLVPLQGLGAIKYCQVVRAFAQGLPRVQGDPTQLEQVFRNLIVNAVQAMEKTRERVLTLVLQPAAEGQRVEARVADTGSGIAPEHLEHIFQPFFTTKPEGTGLGLPIVRTILDQHGAAIAVESQVGVGTQFTLSFPAAI
jgi:PAS domain S-box-containing protein